QFGEIIDFAGDPTWSVAPSSCGSITPSGKFQALSAGACTISAELDGKTGSAAVTVMIGAVPRITAGPSAMPNPTTAATAQLTVGGPASVAASATTSFATTGRDLDGANVILSSCAWMASAGTIDSTGTFTAPATAGPVTITATCGGLSVSTSITVTGSIGP